jgi:NADPH-dependent curcumin reductase CurA
MIPATTRRITLASRPVGEPTPANFTLEEVALPAPGPGQVAVRTVYLSLDPYMRGRMSDAKSYAAPVAIGDVMVGGTVGEVIASEAPELAVGSYVLGQWGWQEHAVVSARAVQRLDPAMAPVSTALGPLGMPGMTAYAGLIEIGAPKAGETVVVGAASGAVGSVVVQLAKARGCRVVGIAGGAAKCAYVVDELGADACVDHRGGELKAALRAACPQGIDIYFENVGGAVWDAVLPLLNDFARVPVCGLIAQYSATSLPEGPNQVPVLMGSILSRRLLIRGFIVTDFASSAKAFRAEVAPLIRDGKLRYREDITDGLAAAPEAFLRLLRGENFGKALVRVGADPTRA